MLCVEYSGIEPIPLSSVEPFLALTFIFHFCVALLAATIVDILLQKNRLPFVQGIRIAAPCMVTSLGPFEE